MKRRHPLRNLVKDSNSELNRICSVYSQRVDEINPSLYTIYVDKVHLKTIAEDFTNEVERLVNLSVRESISFTLEELQNEKEHGLDAMDLSILEAKIENQLRKNFMGKTLRERVLVSQKLVAQGLLTQHQLTLSGLGNLSTTFKGNSFAWNNRLLVSEIFRAYHYTVLEFAKLLNAQSISFIFDKEQLERNKEYVELAEGGPYKLDNLPDYPRPNASYLLEIYY